MATTQEILRKARKPMFTFDVRRDGSESVVKDNTKESEEARKKLLSQRVGIARGLKDLSGRGKLTTDLLKEARSRAMATGSTEKGFNEFLDREGIDMPEGSQTASGAPEGASQAEREMAATQNVMYQREFGEGLASQDAMQDPDYKLGSASPLLQAPRQIGTKSGALRRAARRLRKDGYGRQAGQLAYVAELQKLQEPNIRRPADRKQAIDQRIAAGRLRQQLDQQEMANAQMAGRLTGQQIGGMDDEEDMREGPKMINPEKKRLTKQYL